MPGQAGKRHANQMCVGRPIEVGFDPANCLPNPNASGILALLFILVRQLRFQRRVAEHAEHGSGQSEQGSIHRNRFAA